MADACSPRHRAGAARNLKGRRAVAPPARRGGRAAIRLPYGRA
ncbi:hypothetical protein DFW101_1083 [Solidesulfovibrio carbinoliphilus subsp. oakridgensis]|uniref:Uncharacterized protein n=1 Tax=Solidesulfovibrio carbinoliphilus subsp. oakridgensis TaxID=694327 RepID=G7Q7E1_9BACT|nr:hypothetical protein DFW101_1083 [Solidesulfovibrio carbinoliphilus subsp. oakridgensis]